MSFRRRKNLCKKLDKDWGATREDFSFVEMTRLGNAVNTRDKTRLKPTTKINAQYFRFS
ncbi:hypothetical protein [Flavobacterium sp. KACC 22761]|uniref:hypothetical protein n=1 Tax=Flavobacterium sp. KACC 22761 TaxID=3092665 RepID=UPI002A7560E4|nr:hypothetical protein [Flavobacterium sp. KACC 22761]WPO79132.1 hypothetical protein SCB73_01820 [Flavobacterium sp. KACC 22761]